MRISLIVAMDQNRGIGFQGQIPWNLPADLKMFKSRTMGHHLLMGLKTYESIGKALPGRTTIIVTRNQNFRAKGCLVAHSVTEALEIARNNGEDEIFICGGSEIYREAFKETDRMYLTRIHAEFQVDSSFPNFDLSVWEQTFTDYHPADEKNAGL